MHIPSVISGPINSIFVFDLKQEMRTPTPTTSHGKVTGG